MKIKQTITTLLLAVTIVSAGVMATMPVYANTQQPIDQSGDTPSDGGGASSGGSTQKCGEVDTSIIGGAVCGNVTKDSKDIKQSGVWALLILTLNIMTAGVGILAVGGIAYGAALYASSADKPEQAKQGMTFIKNVVIGLIAYGLMFIILNFLIPGGIFS